MASHFSTLAWKIPWTEEPGGLKSMGSLRVGYDWATSLSIFTFMHWRRKWQPTSVTLPGESLGWGSLWAAIYGVAQSWTRLKRLCSSRSRWPGILKAKTKVGQMSATNSTSTLGLIIYIYMWMWKDLVSVRSEPSHLVSKKDDSHKNIVCFS